MNIKSTLTRILAKLTFIGIMGECHLRENVQPFENARDANPDPILKKDQVQIYFLKVKKAFFQIGSRSCCS